MMPCKGNRYCFTWSEKVAKMLREQKRSERHIYAEEKAQKSYPWKRFVHKMHKTVRRKTIFVKKVGPYLFIRETECIIKA